MPVEGLERFHQAQAGRTGGFEDALRELRARRKAGHWIWYIFPQLAGLGMSPTSQYYGLADVDEAAAYLRDPILRSRLLAAAEAAAAGIRAGVPLTTLMGSNVDALKLVSSLTLFERVAATEHAPDDAGEYQRLRDAAAEILDAAAAQGFPRCRYTLEILGNSAGTGRP